MELIIGGSKIYNDLLYVHGFSLGALSSI